MKITLKTLNRAMCPKERLSWWKWKWSESHSVLSNLFVTPWTVVEWVAFPFSKGSLQPRDWTQLPAMQADSLPAEPQGKPKNTGVGSLSLLQWIFPTQELSQGPLHCRWILYQLNYQGSPMTELLKTGCLGTGSLKRWHLNLAQLVTGIQPGKDLLKSIFLPRKLQV